MQRYPCTNISSCGIELRNCKHVSLRSSCLCGWLVIVAPESHSMSSPSRHGPTWQVCNAVGSGKGDRAVAATMRRGDRLAAAMRQWRTVIDENKSKKEWIIMRCESHSSCHLSVSSKEIMRKIATPTVQEVRCRPFDDSICTEYSSYKVYIK